MLNNRKIFIPDTHKPIFSEKDLLILQEQYYKPIWEEMKKDILRSQGIHIPEPMPDMLPARYRKVKLNAK